MTEFIANRQLLVGADSLLELPAVLQWYGKSRVFLVAYDGQAPCVQALCDRLTRSKCTSIVYDRIDKEPDLGVIDQGADLCVKENCDVVVAVGGGSVIDGAKTIAMIAANGGRTVEYQLEGREVTAHPLLFVAVPTTAGTGAEATKVSVVYNPGKGWKKAIYHTSMIAQVAILDPKVTTGLPAAVTVATGMDAITHAIESYVSVNANPISQMYSLKALELLSGNIEAAVARPEDLNAREAMLLGSYFAGCAISVGTCLAHIVGQPLGAMYSVPHGDACSIFLIPSMELNLTYALPQYVAIAKTLGVDTQGKTGEQSAREGIEVLRQITGSIGAPARLSHYIAPGELDIDRLLDNIQGSMGHIKTNPRPVSRDLFEKLIRSVL